MWWAPESARIDTVVVKNARGHVMLETGVPLHRAPHSVAFGALSVLTDDQRRAFEWGSHGAAAAPGARRESARASVHARRRRWMGGGATRPLPLRNRQRTVRDKSALGHPRVPRDTSALGVRLTALRKGS